MLVHLLLLFVGRAILVSLLPSPPPLPSSPPLPSQSATLSRASLTHDVVMTMHSTSIEGVEDMALLGDLHEAAILYNIQQRYWNDVIYVRSHTRKCTEGCYTNT